MAFRFLHTGDLHLDSPFRGLGTEAPAAIAGVLRESTLLAWRRIVDLAIDERVAFVVVAGDVFENANRTLTGQIHFRDGLARLAEAGIDSFVVTGNHDPESGWSPSVVWPDRAVRFGATHVESRPVVREGTEIARVYGIGYRVRDVRDNLAATFAREADAPFAVGLLHANVGGDTSAGNYAPCTLPDLRRAGMDYWALGHIHRHAVLAEGTPTVVYCGNPQGRDPGETEPRGCYVVTVQDSGQIRPAFHATDEVRWQLVDVPIGGLDTEESIIDAVVAAVDVARSRAQRSIVARVTLTGRGPMHRSLGRADVVGGVQSISRERLGEAAPFAWVESVRDRTRPEVDAAARAQADDFLGSVLRLFADRREAIAAPADGGGDGVGAALDQELDGLFADPRARKHLRGARPRGEALAALLERAETLVVDQLADEG